MNLILNGYTIVTSNSSLLNSEFPCITENNSFMWMYNVYKYRTVYTTPSINVYIKLQSGSYRSFPGPLTKQKWAQGQTIPICLMRE